MFRKPRCTTGLFWNERGLSVVQIEQQKSAGETAKFIRGQIDPTQEDAALAIRRFFEENNLSRESVHAVFPQADMFVKPLLLPAENEKEAFAMAEVQAERSIPIPPEDLVKDFDVLAQEGGEFPVLINAARQSDVMKRMAPLFSAGLNVVQIRPAAHALFAALKDQMSREDCSLFVHGDPAAVTLGFVRNGRLVFYRGSPLLLGPDSTEEEYLAGIVEQIEKSLLTQGTEQSRNLRILLSGYRAELIRPKLEARLKHEVISQKWPDDSPFGKEIAFGDETAAALLPAYGAALLREDPKVPNLLPASVAQENKSIHERAEKLKLAAILAVLLVLTAGIFQQRLMRQKHYAGILNGRVAELSKQAGRAAAYLDGVEQIEKKGAKDVLPFLQEVVRALPARGEIHYIGYQNSGSLDVQCSASLLQDAIKFVKELEKSKLFQSVELKSSRVRGAGSVPGVDFSVHLEFKTAAGEKR